MLFYRPDILAAAGYPEAPRTWSAWRDAMEKIRTASGGRNYAILLPTNEWEQLTIFGVQKGSSLLADDDTRGGFAGPAFRGAAEWYVGLFRDGLAPVVSYTQLGNPYQEFTRSYFAMWITGPWNLGEFRRRLKPEEQKLWMTAPLPAPDGIAWPGPSLAGGSSLAIFKASAEKDAAWAFAEYLSTPAVQSRFYALSGDLPARREAWDDASLAGDVKAQAFRVQLTRVEPMPRVPEWEQIAQKVAEDMEPAIRGRLAVPAALATLDADVDHMLEKRRWILAHASERRSRGRKAMSATTTADGRKGPRPAARGPRGRAAPRARPRRHPRPLHRAHRRGVLALADRLRHLLPRRRGEHPCHRPQELREPPAGPAALEGDAQHGPLPLRRRPADDGRRRSSRPSS